MIIQSLAREIYIWIDKHAGKSPRQVRVSKAVLDAMEEEAINFGRHRRRQMGGDFKVAGVNVVLDEGMMLGAIDA